MPTVATVAYPDDRLVVDQNGRPQPGVTVALFADPANLTAAPISLTKGGPLIPGSTVVTDEQGMLPVFYGPGGSLFGPKDPAGVASELLPRILTAADLGAAPVLPVAASQPVASAVLTPGVINVISAAAAAGSLALPAGLFDGQQMGVSRDQADTSLNVITLTGKISGVAGSQLTIRQQRQSHLLAWRTADSSWYPVAVNRSLVDDDARYTGFAGSRLVLFGHSQAASAGSSTPERGWAHLVASALRSSLTSLAFSGAVLERNSVVGAGAGGYADVLNGWQIANPVTFRGAYTAAANYWFNDVVTYSGGTWKACALTFSGKAPGTLQSGTNLPYWQQITSPTSQGATSWVPQKAVPVFMFGLNDLAVRAIAGEGISTTTGIAAFLASLRTVLAFTACSAVFDDNDPSVTYTAGFAARSGVGTSAAYGGFFRVLPNSLIGTDYGTIAVPPDFAGGTIDLGFSVVGGATGVLQANVDGTQAATLNIAGLTENSTYNNEVTIRLTGLAPGAHTITFGWGSGPSAAAAAFDWWGIEPVVPGPQIVLSQLYIPTASYGNAFYNNTFSEVDVAAWNTATQAMVTAEFPTAQWVDVSLATNRSLQAFCQDGIHPNDLGNEQIAATVLAALAAKAPPAPAAVRQASQHRPNNVQTLPLVGGDFTVAAQAGFQNVVNGSQIAEITVDALPGDLLEVTYEGVWFTDTTNTGHYADLAIIARGSLQGYVSSDGAPTTAANGLTAAFTTTIPQPRAVIPVPIHYVAKAADITNGTITLRVQVATSPHTATATVFGSSYASGVPSRLTCRNHGQPNAYHGSGVGL